MMHSLFLMMLLAGSTLQLGDVADFVSTQDYWQMRDERIVTVQTMSAVLADEESTQVDRLMAIRALGELGASEQTPAAEKATALETLEPLVASNEPFVGRYAKRSIAWIKGEDPEPIGSLTRAQIDSDLALLPKDAAMVGHIDIANAVGPMDMATLIPALPAGAGVDRKKLISELSRSATETLTTIGNARVDSVAFGIVISDLERGDISAAIVIRGEFDRIGLQLGLEKWTEGQDSVRFYSIGQIEVMSDSRRGEPVAILMPSNDRVVILFGGGNGQDAENLPIAEMAAALQAGGGEPTFNETIAGQIKQIDRDGSSGWMALQITKAMREQSDGLIGPYDAARLQLVRGTKGAANLSWTADAKPEAAEQVTAHVAMVNTQLAQGVAAMEQMAAQQAELAVIYEPVLKLLKSIEIQSEQGSMVGSMKLDIKSSLSAPFLFGFRALGG